MLRSLARFLSLLFIVSTVLGQSVPPSMLGFSSAGARAQTDLESRFDAALSVENLRDWLKRLSARPHHLGSAYNKENAEFIAAQFRS